MLQQSQGAVEIISFEACEDNMLLLPKGYQQHLVGSCTVQVGGHSTARWCHCTCVLEEKMIGRGAHVDVWQYG